MNHKKLQHLALNSAKIVLSIALAIFLTFCGGGNDHPATQVSVTGVTLNKSTMALDVEQTETLTATVLPDNASNKNVSWRSDNTNVATVSSTGLVTGLALGTAKITVTTADGNKTSECSVTVTAAQVSVTGVTLNESTMALYVEQTETLTATVLPDNATNKNVSWSSDDINVATVSSTGIVTAVAPGTAKITVITEDGNITAECDVTVTFATVAVTGVKITRKHISLMPYESETLIAVVEPENATNKNVIWSTSNQAVATVTTDGLVTMVGLDTATITVTTADGNKTANCDATAVNVYMGGEYDDNPAGFYITYPALWTNGVPKNLMTQTKIDNESWGGVLSVFVTDNGDVYTSGYESYVDWDLYDSVFYPVVWKNGTYQPRLMSSEFYNQELARSIFVVGNDVYAAGDALKYDVYNWVESQEWYPKLWKNGDVQELEFDKETKYAGCDSVFVSNGNVYVAGMDRSAGAVLWTDGKVKDIGSTASSYASSVYVSGSDVYVGGSDSSHATVWKNDVPTHYDLTEGSISEFIYNIFVSGNDVYAVGYAVTQSSPRQQNAMFWKNGVAQTINIDTGTGFNYSEATSVYVFGDDVYIAVNVETMTDIGSTLWKNGIVKWWSPYDSIYSVSVAKAKTN